MLCNKLVWIWVFTVVKIIETLRTKKNVTSIDVSTPKIKPSNEIATGELGLNTKQPSSDSYEANIVSAVIGIGCILGFIIFAVVMSQLCCIRSESTQTRGTKTDDSKTVQLSGTNVGKPYQRVPKEPLTQIEALSSIVVSN